MLAAREFCEMPAIGMPVIVYDEELPAQFPTQLRAP
jgi:hypothetical protein